MKLLTHNMLTSSIIKNVKKGYPLIINAEKVNITQVDFNAEFVKRMIPKLEYSALLQAARQLQQEEGLPEELTTDYENNEDLLKKLHHVLMEVEVIDGSLECPESGRKFPITNGIPNMLLNEDEV